MMEIGRKLSGRYKIIGSIGSGGMANVYLAHDLILNRDVAVKVLRFDFQNDKDAIRRFQREALASTELVHPNIVSVYDVGEDDGMQFIVMEYVKGTDLKRFIQTQYPIPYEVVVEIMKQILSAMSLAHQHRIIHRDLKPQNILINEAGDVKITDFGIAIALSETSITQTNTLLGSVHYLSPEQARGSMATKQSDIYAMGVILYELLSGRVPFEGESAVSIALKHFQEEIPSLRAVNPAIPQALENVVLHATAKEPADRYPSAEAMEADLSTALSPMRANEEPFKPKAMLNDTKVITPVKPPQTSVPQAFQQMERPTSPNPLNTAKANDSGNSNNPRKSSNKKKVIAIIGVLFVLVACVLAFLIFSTPSDTKVPDVKGRSQNDAITLLEAAKLKVATEVEEIADEEIQEGNVVKTSPAAGDSVKEGRTVTLFVSSGKKSVTMISVVGETEENAKKKLIEKGFKSSNIEVKQEASDSVEKGKVISQSPEENEEVTPDETKITLTVSKGVEKVKVPSVKGILQGTAEELIMEAGLVPSVSAEYSDSADQGVVISCSPSEGRELEKGSTVSLVVSKGPEKTTTSSTEVDKGTTFQLTVSIPSDASSVDPNKASYDVYYADADSNYEYKKYNSAKLTFLQLQSGYLINSIHVTGDKGAKVKVLEDGAQIFEQTNITSKQDIIVRF